MGTCTWTHGAIRYPRDHSVTKYFIGSRIDSEFNKLPDELLQKIFSFLTISELTAARNVSRRWNTGASSVIENACRQKLAGIEEIPRGRLLPLIMRDTIQLNQALKIQEVTDDVIEKLVEKHPYCLSVTLYSGNADKITCAAVITIQKKLKLLDKFSLLADSKSSFFSNLSVRCLDPIASFHPDLSKLTIEGELNIDPKLEDDCEKHLFQSLNKLRSLHICLVSTNSRTAIDYIAKNGRNLKHLYLKGKIFPCSVESLQSLQIKSLSLVNTDEKFIYEKTEAMPNPPSIPQKIRNYSPVSLLKKIRNNKQ